jgi:hypothetical protein
MLQVGQSEHRPLTQNASLKLRQAIYNAMLKRRR